MLIMAARKSRAAGRDSRTGQFIKVSEAKRRPATTQVERLPLPGFGTEGHNKKKKS